MADVLISGLTAASAAALTNKIEVEETSPSASKYITGTQLLALMAANLSFQPLDSDLTAIAALTTTAFGRALLALADAAAGRTALGLGTAATQNTGAFEASGAVATHEADTTSIHGIADTAALLTTSAAAAAYQPLDSDLTAIAALSTTSFGRALLALADAAALRTAGALGTAATADTGTGAANVPTITQADARYQALDSDLTAIAALSTTSYGRSLLAAANAAALRTLAGLVIGTDVQAPATTLAGYGITDAQPLDSDLTAIAALTTTSFGRSLLAAADAAALRTLAALGSLAVLSSITASLISDASANGRSLITAADYAAMKTLLALVIGTNVQAWDADLDAIAAIATTAFGRSYLALADAAAARTLAASAPLSATYITQTANSELSAEQALSALATGYMKVTTTTGVISSQATPIPSADLGSGGAGAGAKVLADNQTWITPSGGVSDGDKGDVTVSGSGTVWTVDALPESRITDLVTDLAAKAGLALQNILTGTWNAFGTSGTPQSGQPAYSASVGTGIFNSATGAQLALVYDNYTGLACKFTLDNGLALNVTGAAVLNGPRFGIGATMQSSPWNNCMFGVLNSGATKQSLVMVRASGQSANMIEVMDEGAGMMLSVRFDGLLDGTIKSVALKVKAGVPADGDWTSAPPNGTLALDSTNGRLYARIGGAWTYARIGDTADSQALTDGASIAWNVALGAFATVTLAGNRTLANPTNIKAGTSYVLKVTQDGTGSRTLAYGSAYKWPAGTPPVLSTAIGAVDMLTFVSDGTNMYGSILKAFA